MNVEPEKPFLTRSSLNRAIARVLPERFSEPNPDYTTERLLKALTSNVFLALDRVGVHVLPKHFYTPVADYTWLRNNQDSWRYPVEMHGITWDLDEQAAWLISLCRPYYAEVEDLRSFESITSGGAGPGYGPIESQVLHCFIRKQRPKLVIEVGSGVSTQVMRQAAQRNRQDGTDETRITAIEPYPREMLRSTEGIDLIESLVQKTPLSLFDRLEAGDLLFVDSSHAVKTGSDVDYLCLEVIPRLKPGVFIQFHDIFLPYLFSPTALSDYFGWQESAMVMALLINNSQLSVLCCQSALHFDRPEALASIFPVYSPQEFDRGLAMGDPAKGHFPNSLWLQTS